MAQAALVLVAAFVLAGYVAERIAYRETAASREHLARLVASRGRDAQAMAGLRHRFDGAFAVLAFVRTWAEVLLCWLAMRLADGHPAWCVLLAVGVASRLRALQEISHFAVHAALGLPAATQLRLANLFFQYPLMRVPARARRRSHVAVHHRHSNTPGRDPNLDDLAEAGIVPGCGRAALWRGVLFPLRPREIVRGVGRALAQTLAAPPRERLARTLAVLAMAAAAWGVAGLPGLVFGVLLPRFVLYPWFAWWSQLLEHTWYAPMAEQRPFVREFEAGRATHYGPLAGALLRYLVLPCGDSYHLAHSLFPRLRWNHLPRADRLLAQASPAYARRASQGLFFGRRGAPAAFDWLRTTAG